MEQAQQRVEAEKPSKKSLLIQLAAFAAMAGLKPLAWKTVTPRMRGYPQPMCSPPGVIAAWNAQVEAAKKPRPARVRRQRRDDGQHPKFAPQRAHKQHKHELRDEHGTYTLTGGVYTMEGDGIRPSSREHLIGGVFEGAGAGGHSEYTARRKWLAGISAQRGY